MPQSCKIHNHSHRAEIKDEIVTGMFLDGSMRKNLAIRKAEGKRGPGP
jgi:hypothetical protein